MSDYVIISDSTCDLPQEFVDKEGVQIQPMTYRIQGKEFKNYLDGREQSPKEFYDLMRQGEVATTAQLNIVDIENFWKPFLEAGHDLLILGFSSGLSGSYNAMRMAKEELSEEYPERTILLIDTLCASSGEGLMVYYATEYRKKGLSLEENYQELLKLRPHIITWFTVDDIDTLVRGGRLSGGAATMAKMLRIKPVLKVDEEGHLQAIYKKIGRKQAMKQLVDSTMKVLDRSYHQLIMVGHADAKDEAIELSNMIQKEAAKQQVSLEVMLTDIGPVIGAHAGPGTLLITSVGSNR